MREVPVDALHDGYVLAESVYDGDGRLLLRDGSALTEERRRVLRMRGIERVLAVSPHPRPLATGQPPDPGETRRRARETLVAFFDAAKTGRAFASERVRRLVETVLDQILYDPSAALTLAKSRAGGEDAFDHAIAVAAFSTVFALNLGYDRRQVEEVALAALLHDVGMTMVPGAILDKAGPLTEEEWARIVEHTTAGFDMLRRDPAFSSTVAVVALQHHERLDGSGYPAGLRGDAIDARAQLVAVADVYDAMTSDRPYRRRIPADEALQMLMRQAGTKLNRQVCLCLLRTLALYPPGTHVRLNTGEVGVVQAVPTWIPTRPIIQVTHDRAGRRHATPYLLNLLHFPNIFVDDVLDRRQVVTLELLRDGIQTGDSDFALER